MIAQIITPTLIVAMGCAAVIGYVACWLNRDDEP